MWCELRWKCHGDFRCTRRDYVYDVVQAGDLVMLKVPLKFPNRIGYGSCELQEVGVRENAEELPFEDLRQFRVLSERFV